MTAAMIASNSFCKPRSAAAEPASATCSTAKSAEQSAVTTNRLTLTRATGTPIFFAAFASPPTARIQLPQRVRASTKPPIAVSTIHHTITFGTPDGKRAATVARGDPAPARPSR